jgi:hypothetical protein
MTELLPRTTVLRSVHRQQRWGKGSGHGSRDQSPGHHHQSRGSRLGVPHLGRGHTRVIPGRPRPVSRRSVSPSPCRDRLGQTLPVRAGFPRYSTPVQTEHCECLRPSSTLACCGLEPSTLLTVRNPNSLSGQSRTGAKRVGSGSLIPRIALTRGRASPPSRSRQAAMAEARFVARRSYPRRVPPSATTPNASRQMTRPMRPMARLLGGLIDTVMRRVGVAVRRR